MTFSAVVVLHDSAGPLHALLDSLPLLPEPPQLIVVDTGSRDEGAELARAAGAEVVELGANPGFGAANNAGVERARHPVTVLLNPDCELLDGSLDRLAGAAATGPERLWVPRLLEADGAVQRSAHPLPGTVGALLPALVPPELLPRALRERAEPYRAERPARSGGRSPPAWRRGPTSCAASAPFDPGQFLFFEDMDLCLRARAAGDPDRARPERARPPPRRPRDPPRLRRRAARAARAPPPRGRAGRPRQRGRARSTTPPRRSRSPRAPPRASPPAARRTASRRSSSLSGVPLALRGHNDARVDPAPPAPQTATRSSRWCARAASCTARGPIRPSAPTSSRSSCSRCAREDFACFVVIDDESGDLAGIFNISQIVRGSFQSAFLGYYGSARHAGKGLMREGLEQVLDYAFGPLSLHRIEANIQPGNAASIALARGAGFRLEGYSPRYLLIGGQWRDHERYALTATSVRTAAGEVAAPPDSQACGEPTCPTPSSAARSSSSSATSPGGDVLLEVRDRRRARDQQDPVVARQQPRQRDLGGRRAVLLGHRRRSPGPRRASPGPPVNAEPSGKNGTNAISRSRHSSSTPRPRGRRCCTRSAPRRASTSSSACSTLSQRRRCETPMRSSLPSWRMSSSAPSCSAQRDVRAAVVVEQPQVDEVHALDPQRAQVLLDARAQLVRGRARAASRPCRRGARRPS